MPKTRKSPAKSILLVLLYLFQKPFSPNPSSKYQAKTLYYQGKLPHWSYFFAQNQEIFPYFSATNNKKIKHIEHFPRYVLFEYLFRFFITMI